MCVFVSVFVCVFVSVCMYVACQNSVKMDYTDQALNHLCQSPASLASPQGGLENTRTTEATPTVPTDLMQRPGQVQQRQFLPPPFTLLLLLAPSFIPISLI